MFCNPNNLIVRTPLVSELVRIRRVLLNIIYIVGFLVNIGFNMFNYYSFPYHYYHLCFLGFPVRKAW